MGNTMKTTGWSRGFARALAILAVSALAGTASLSSLAYTVTITPVPAGGYVTSNPVGIYCGTGGSNCTSTNIPFTTPVNLTAHPDAGCSFVQWSVAGSGTSTANPLSFPMPNQNVSGSATFQCAPNFTSAAIATFQTGIAGSFNVTASGVPSPTFSVTSGSLPGGVSLASDGTLSGTPNAGTGGQHSVTITAANGVSPPATQGFTLTVNQPPALPLGGATLAFPVGEAGAFTSTASGFPVPTVTLVAGALPFGVTLSTDGTFSGTPAAGTAGTYFVTIKASNGIAPDATTFHNLMATQAPGLIPMTSQNFEGLGQGFVGPAGAFTTNYLPSGANIAVGPNHVVQVVNAGMVIFDKAGTALAGPMTIRNLWGGNPSACSSRNDGQSIAQYDRAADRWVVTHTAIVPPTTFTVCIAVSQTPDPTGAYHLYPLAFSQGIDQPVLAVWPDAYYLAFDAYSNDYQTYQGAKACALDRNRMLQGQAATPQCFDTGNAHHGLLPSDLDGTTPPPAGSPNYVMALGTEPNTLALWAFHVDWTTPANSTFTGPTTIATQSFTLPCGGDTTLCIPQEGTTNLLDSRGDRLLYRLAYRNFGDHEAIVASHVVTAGTSVGMRWYELRAPGTAPSIFQQGTHAPDAHHRFGGSAAMDWMGTLAIGYSVSSATMSPQIRYAARLASDSAGALSQGEATVFAGGGSQSGNRRWGHITSMRLDPADDCTFWYTAQYMPYDALLAWRTRIASFKLATCIPATTTKLVSSPNPSVYGQNYSVTATVAGRSPTGTVTFRMGSSVIATKTLVSGSASQAVTSYAVGTFPFTATYSGDSANGGSVSPTLSHVVNKASATVSIVSHTPDPSAVGAAVTVGVSVNLVAPGSGPVTGTVTVSDGTANCTITLPATSCTLTPLSAGAKMINASYWGDSHVNAATASGVPHTVVRSDQSITFGTPPIVTVGGTGSVSATATSGLPVAYSTASPTCSVHAASGLVTGISTGSCTIAANQAGNGNYYPAPQVTQVITIQPGFVLTVSKSGAGTVISSPAGIDCGATCSSSFNAAASVALTASASAGSFFAGWGGACSGIGACNVTMDATKSVTATFKLNTTIPRLANIATRMQVLTGADVLIGGFIIGGSQAKTVVVRARGPSLTAAGVPGALQNPLLQLFSGQTQIGVNDDWQQATNAGTVLSSGFAPADARESAILTTLGPGAYTAIVSGAGGTTGVGIVEVFEVDLPEVPLINIATRGQVLTGADVMIGGFIIQGDSPQTVIVRARGPSLTALGVPGALQNPLLQLFSGQTQIAVNDDWQTDTNAVQIQTRGFAPSDARESAILVTLSPGAYTAIVTGAGSTTGVGIIEVFAQ